jgi:hypothetical protein
MIEIAVDGEMLLEARDKAAEMGRLRNSITNGGGNIAGFIGESVAQRVLGGKLDNTYDYDLVLDNGVKIDVKTKLTSVEPLPEYDCSVAALNTEQECDYYCFVRVKKDLTTAWYLGIYSKEHFVNDATFMQKGMTDLSNGYTVKSDCYNIPISKLKDRP